MALLDADGDQVVIQAPASPRLPKVMASVRARLDGDRWRTAGHRCLDVADALALARPQRSDAFEELTYRTYHGGDMDHVQACLAVKRGIEPPRDIPLLRKPLYPYQEHAVAFLDRAGSGILADEPGLGKTLQGIAFALLSPRPCLIVCPATAKHVWQREIEAAVPVSDDRSVQVLSGLAPQRLTGARFTIVNHDILAAHADVLGAAGFGCLIADEVHRCKNIRAQRTKALIRIADGIDRRLLLSGTLMMNSAEDLFPPLRIVRPEAYPHFGAFCDRYMTSRPVRKQVRGRWRRQRVRVASRNLPELHHRMESFLIRRTLSDVRDQLPELRHTVHAVDLPDHLREDYREALRPALGAADGAGARRGADAALKVCHAAKAEALRDLVEERAAAGRKSLVFSTRLSLLDAVQDDFPEALRIDGSVPTPARRAIEEAFQSPDGPGLFLGQTRACGEAITLDAADTVIIADADWSPQANEQAIRRAMRINTDHPVEVVWLVAKDTIDEARLEVLRRKSGEFHTVMEGEVVDEALAAVGRD